MPPPADASTVTAFTCRCRSSCICLNLESICWSAPTSIFIVSLTFRVALFLCLPSDFRDSSLKAFQHGLDLRVILELRPHSLSAPVVEPVFENVARGDF